VFFIYYLSPFYLDFICFYFFSRTILLQLQVILFQIFERSRLGAKERLFGADSRQNYEDFVQNYRYNPCLRRIQSQLQTREHGTGRARPLDSFLLLLLLVQAAYFSFFLPKADGFLWNNLLMYFLGPK